MTRRVYVFHNLNALSMFRGLEQGDDLKVVHYSEIIGPFANEQAMLSRLFTMFNNVEDKPSFDVHIDNEYKRMRSLTTGDVLTLVDGNVYTSYACQAVGWQKLPKPVTNNGSYGFYRGEDHDRRISKAASNSVHSN